MLNYPTMPATKPQTLCGLEQQPLCEMEEGSIVPSIQQELAGQAQPAEQAVRELAIQLSDMQRLHTLSTRLMQHAGGLESAMREVLEAARELMHADKCSAQVHDPHSKTLNLAASIGLDQAFADRFAVVDPQGMSTCAALLRSGKRVIVEDLSADPNFCEFGRLAATQGVRSAMSTPLLGADGQLLGVFTTYWRRPHRPSGRELQLLDLYAQQAAWQVERRAAEQALRESEDRFRMIANNIGALAWNCDKLGNVTWYNNRWLDYTGLPFEELKDWGWTKCHHPEHVDRVVASISRSRETGEVWEDTFPLRGADGQYRWFLSRAYPIRDRVGNVIRWFGTNTDITAELQAKRQAEDASRAKDRFLAVLSHELRTPLTPVLVSAAALEMRQDLPPEVRDDVAMIRRNVELQSRLIDDLLDLSRITSGKLRLTLDALDVDELLRHACDTCRPSLRERGIQLHCDLDDRPFKVVGDAGRLQQVFWNLLNNAAKFTSEGGQVFVRTENVGEAGDERVRVTVRDTGIGIVAEDLRRIFDAFEQAEQPEPGSSFIARRFGGMGLGLAICRAILEQHRGSISAHSDGKGKGSTFIVELPALVSAVQAGAADHPLAPAPQKLRSLRLLVVDDHPDTVRILGRLLTAAGHHVHTAGTAGEALRLADQHAFDLIISDLGLPDMTGYELMRQIRQRRHVQGIAMSGYGMEEDIRKSERAGFSDHLVKPLNVSQLEQSIRRVANAISAGSLPQPHAPIHSLPSSPGLRPHDSATPLPASSDGSAAAETCFSIRS